MSTEAARGAFEPAWPSRAAAPPLGEGGRADRYQPPPLRLVAADPDPERVGPRPAALASLTFDEGDLARAFGAGVWQGLRATAGSAAAQRERAAARALRLLRHARRYLAAAQAEELDRVAGRAASILCALLDDLSPVGSAARARSALQGLLREALAAGAGAGTLTVETTEDVVAALRPALADQHGAMSAAAVELRVDPDLPSDALRVRWSTGWAEARAAAVVGRLRERLAAELARTTGGDRT